MPDHIGRDQAAIGTDQLHGPEKGRAEIWPVVGLDTRFHWVRFAGGCGRGGGCIFVPPTRLRLCRRAGREANGTSGEVWEITKKFFAIHCWQLSQFGPHDDPVALHCHDLHWGSRRDKLAFADDREADAVELSGAGRAQERDGDAVVA